MREFIVASRRVYHIVALRISLYGTTIKTELRLLAKERDVVRNISAMTDEEWDAVTVLVTELIEAYDEMSRNRRKQLLKDFYENIKEARIND